MIKKLESVQYDDLKIYHNGSHSRIEDAGTGKIQIGSGTQVEILNGSFAEPIAQFNPNGAVNLYYDNSKKFETKSDGVDITGEVQCDTLDVDGSADIKDLLALTEPGNATFHGNVDLHDNDLLRIGTGDDLQIYHNGTNSFIENGTGGLTVATGLSARRK